MFICEDFVFVHMPKTGGTFVTDILHRLYPNGYEHQDKHGTCSDIPLEFSHLPIVSVIRNPFDRYVSQYFFAWWKRNLSLYCGDKCHAKYGDLTDISFKQFVHLADDYFKGYFQSKPNGYDNQLLSSPVGWHTEQHIRFYFKQPQQVFNQLTDESLQDLSFLSAQYDVTILHNEHLNQQLYQWLRTVGHSEQSLGFLLQAERILPEGGKPRQDRDWLQYYDQQTLSFVSQRERLLLQLYPQYQQEL